MGSGVLHNAIYSAGALFTCLLALWLISLKAKDASIIDIFWGAGFAIVGAVCLWLSEMTPYQILLAALPIIWGIRLTLYLAKRNLGHGEDKRYIFMQERAAKKGMSEMAWRRRAFFTIFLGQGLLIMIVSAPVWVAMATGLEYADVVCATTPCNSPPEVTGAIPIGPIAVIGTLLWLIGFLFEAIGDMQLSKFMRKMKTYKGAYADKPVLDTGLWKYTRHPNYFGNACMWWGIWLVACQAPWGWVTIFAPIVMNLLLVRVSGKDLLERGMAKRTAYQDYIKRTSGFFPMPPKS